MLGKYTRDALTVSALDSGGKTLVKSPWRGYEKNDIWGRGNVMCTCVRPPESEKTVCQGKKHQGTCSKSYSIEV
ncbi:hypothetical protein M404DRAFT_376049 [Pisolithus tinctorius Marx 270]|uniref:Uncharacterized protein n=1 Tax=Pisolithus tinctorius Marx 270 TaxID=870435 RepID=A0A0C3PHH7_PISTI|nr:hypothetical protein M404DRAFT_376049 [Pisolithus tinctorius Marx 270]